MIMTHMPGFSLWVVCDFTLVNMGRSHVPSPQDQRRCNSPQRASAMVLANPNDLETGHLKILPLLYYPPFVLCVYNV